MKKIFLILLILIILAGGSFYFALFYTPADRQAIPEEMPDVVIPPNESTPDTPPPTINSTTDEKSGITFQFASTLGEEYISTSDWPPRFISSYAPVDCELDEQTQAMSGLTATTRTVNGRNYCIWYRNEGATGSTYTNYQVSFPKGNQYVTMSFTLRYPQCSNYPTEQKSACEVAQRDFPLYELIDEIAQSTTLPDL